MTTMRAAVLRAYRDLVIQEMPIPEVEPGGLLVRTHACGICSGDIMPWYIERKAPLVLGHEMAGVVEAASADAPFREGDRIFAHHHAPCMKCAWCRRGLYVQCTTWKQPAIVPGGCAEFFAVSATGANFDALIIPDHLPLEAGCLIEPLGCCVKGFNQTSDDRCSGLVVVLGLGPMGLLNLRLAKYYGAQLVIAVDTVPFRMELAKKLGADLVLDYQTQNIEQEVREASGGKMADLVVVGPPQAAAMQSGLAVAGPGAVVLLFSPVTPGQSFTYDPNISYFKEIQFIPSYSCGPDDTQQALELLSAGLIDLDLFISHRFPLERAAEAYNLVADGRDSAKVLVTF